MFIPVAFHSVNLPSSLAPGRYGVTCACYGRADETSIALLFQYALKDQTPQAAAADLLMMECGGTLRARDFLWMPDRSWRDSDGIRANRLEALLPAELLK